MSSTQQFKGSPLRKYSSSKIYGPEITGFHAIWKSREASPLNKKPERKVFNPKELAAEEFLKAGDVLLSYFLEASGHASCGKEAKHICAAFQKALHDVRENKDAGSAKAIRAIAIMAKREINRYPETNEWLEHFRKLCAELFKERTALMPVREDKVEDDLQKLGTNGHDTAVAMKDLISIALSLKLHSNVKPPKPQRER